MAIVAVTGSFDDLRSKNIRFLEEAAKLGDLHVQLWSDKTVMERTGKAPKFPEAERLYFVDAMRYVKKAAIEEKPPAGGANGVHLEEKPLVWAVEEAADNSASRQFAEAHGV